MSTTKAHRKQKETPEEEGARGRASYVGVCVFVQRVFYPRSLCVLSCVTARIIGLYLVIDLTWLTDLHRKGGERAGARGTKVSTEGPLSNQLSLAGALTVQVHCNHPHLLTKQTHLFNLFLSCSNCE